jgi:hypothetical protein
VRDADRLVGFAVGLGFTSTEAGGHEGQGSGGFLEGEYVYRPSIFFAPRVYAGGLVTFPDKDSCGVEPCKVHSQIMLLGAKARLVAPIPYVAPFIEGGIGLSLGHLRTLDQSDIDEEMTGLTLHVPFALGLAMGRNHDLSVSFGYLIHPFFSQFSGALTVGMAFLTP